jgi:hypothetical protein
MADETAINPQVGEVRPIYPAQEISAGYAKQQKLDVGY